MLVLTRKLQEQLRIGDNVTVTVLQVKGNSVRLGIEAPRDISVLRGELPIFDEQPTDTAASPTSVPRPAASPRMGSAEQSRANSKKEEPNARIRPSLSSAGRSLAARVERCLSQSDVGSVDNDLAISIEIVHEKETV